MTTQGAPGALAQRLNEVLEESGQAPLRAEIAQGFENYAKLLMRWNTRVNLTAIRDEEGVLRRHFAESIACARALPENLETLLDLGSGAGFPGVPIALCRPEIAVTLAESQGKKAAFLREVLRTLNLKAEVHGGRAEMLGKLFDCVALRAVDRMEDAVRAGAALVRKDGFLALLCTGASAEGLRKVGGEGVYRWQEPVQLPGGGARLLVLGRRLA